MVTRKKDRNSEKNRKRRKKGLEAKSGKHRKAVRKWKLKNVSYIFGRP